MRVVLLVLGVIHIGAGEMSSPDWRNIQEIKLTTRNTEYVCNAQQFWVYADGTTRLARERCVPADDPEDLPREVWEYRRGRVGGAALTKLLHLPARVGFQSLEDFYPGECKFHFPFVSVEVIYRDGTSTRVAESEGRAPIEFAMMRHAIEVAVKRSVGRDW